MATEALAYANDDEKIDARSFKNAELYYSIATRLNPREKYFWDAHDRIRAAISRVNPEMRVVSRPKVATPADPKTGTGVEILMTNSVVIELLKSGLNEANLVWLIKNQRRTHFDLSAAGVKHLLNNMMTNAVIAAMRESQSPPTQPTPQPQRKRP